MASQTIERLVLAVLVLVVIVEAYLAYSAYSTVQAQVAKITALEREVAAVKENAEARVKKLEDDFSRFRR